MSILIKGMEMPKDCFSCPLNYDSIDCMVADIALREKGGGDFLYEHERASKCPLIELPSHGRLIDADVLFDFVLNIYKMAQGDARKVYRDVLDMIVAAGDVIPSEEGE